MYYLCPGCRRRCRGFITVCLDCEFAMDAFRRLGYAHGVQYGTEWGVAHAYTLSKETEEPEWDLSLLPSSRATAYLPADEEANQFARAVRDGITRGMRIARRRKTHFSKKCLPACILEAGRRSGTATALMYFVQPRFQRENIQSLLDYNVFRIIREMVRGSQISGNSRNSRIHRVEPVVTSLEIRQTIRDDSERVDTAVAENH